MKQFSIVRERYVIVRDEKEILCGMLGNYKFRPFDSVRNIQLKTYESMDRAEYGLENFTAKCQDTQKHTYKIVPVVESIIATGPMFDKKGKKPCK